MLVDVLHWWGDRILFDQPAGETSYTYRQTADLLAKMIRVLREDGLGRGFGLGVLANNRPEAWFAAVAPQIGGGYYTALPARASVDDLAFMIDKAELRVLVVDPPLADIAAELQARCGSLERTYSLGPSDIGIDLLARAHAQPATRLTVAAGLRPDDICHLWFTGGTTGQPKASVHTHTNVIQASYRNLMAHEYPPQPRYGAVGPLSHSGYPFVMPTISAGGSVTVIPVFDPEKFFDIAADRRFNYSMAVPTMLYALLEYAEDKGLALPHMERFLYGAAPMASEPLQRLIERFGPIFTQLYGASEFYAPGAALLSDEHLRPELLASCGRPVPGVEIALLDDDDQPVEVGQVGEVCVRSESMSIGYFKEPELTAEAFSGGWFHVGDLARANDEGYMWIVDRKKDMIVSGGFNVYPVEVENALMEDPAVGHAAVIGVPDDKWGERVHAVVVPAHGATVDVDVLMNLVRERKGSVYAPKTIDIVEAMPVTPAGKVDKKVLREPFWAGRDRRVG